LPWSFVCCFWCGASFGAAIFLVLENSFGTAFLAFGQHPDASGFFLELESRRNNHRNASMVEPAR